MSATTKTKPNFWYAIASTTLVLFLLGVFGLIVLYANEFIQRYKESVEIMVELKEEADPTSINIFKDYLSHQSFLRAGTLRFTSKEDAAAQMQKEFGNDFMAFGDNPLYNTLTFNIQAQAVQPDSLKRIAATIKQNGLVSDVYYQEALIKNIGDNIRNLGIITLLVSFIFIFIAANLIHNTVKLSLYSNRFLIKNMQLVGASWEFITRPYLVKSYLNGLLSGVLASLGLFGFILLLYQQMPELRSIEDTTGILVVCVVILAVGVLISGWSTRRCINKYLRMRLDDLY